MKTKSPEEFYHSAAWLHKREAVLRRDGYLCQECRRYGRKDRDGLPVRATLVHHVIEYEDAPELGLVDSNLVSLCDGCHNKKHPDRARRRGDPPRFG